MAETPEIDAEIGRQNLALAQVLFRRFGILHSFHEQHLIYYTVACCGASLGGTVSVDPDTKSVSFELKTFRYYKRVDKKIIKRSAYSLGGYIKYPPKKYEAECKTALTNLNAWCKELLWGAETSVKVMIDGREIK